MIRASLRAVTFLFVFFLLLMETVPWCPGAYHVCYFELKAGRLLLRAGQEYLKTDFSTTIF